MENLSKVQNNVFSPAPVFVGLSENMSQITDQWLR